MDEPFHRRGAQAGGVALTLPVVHATLRWLPQTMTWLHGQLRHAEGDVTSHVVAATTENLDQFPWPRIHAVSDASWWRGLKSLRVPMDHPVVDGVVMRARLRLLERVLASTKARVLHSHFGDMGWWNVPLARRVPDLAHVVTFYGFDVNHLPARDPAWRTRYRELFAEARAILALGPNMARELEALGCPREKVRVHAVGVSVDDIRFEPRHLRAGEPFRVLLAGSFREKKGIPYALEALAQVRTRLSMALEITLIGDASAEARSQAEKARILATIREHDLPVRLLGYAPHHRLFEEAYRHHVYLAPSVMAKDGDTEGTPVTLMELMATGMPVVSTRHADIPSIVPEGCGVLVKERDVEVLADALAGLAAEPASWKAMTQAARSHIERSFNARVQADAAARLYRELAEGGPRA